MPRWAWFATVAIACGQRGSAPPPRTPAPPPAAPVATPPAPPRSALADDLPRLALRARQLYIDWHAAFSDDNLDCPSATARMNELADKNADLIAANQQVMKQGHDKVRALRAELEKYEQEMAPVAKSIVESPIMSRCAGDQQFGKAVDRLQGEG